MDAFLKRNGGARGLSLNMNENASMTDEICTGMTPKVIKGIQK